jgi:ATP-dependent RNA helicase DeaD
MDGGGKRADAVPPAPTYSADTRPARDDRGDRAERPERGERGDRPPRDNRGETGAKRRDFGSGKLAKYRIEVGRAIGVLPKEIVGAIANEGGIDGKSIGQISLFDDYSTVELPSDLPADTIAALGRIRVRQVALKTRLAEPGECDDTRPPRRSGPSSPWAGDRAGSGGGARDERPRSFDKPYEKKPYERKPFESKPFENKPFENKSFEKKPYEKKPFEKKPFEKKPFEKRPFAKTPR